MTTASATVGEVIGFLLLDDEHFDKRLEAIVSEYGDDSTIETNDGYYESYTSRNALRKIALEAYELGRADAQEVVDDTIW